MKTDKKERRFFYGYIVAAAGFTVWFIGWGVYSICFGVFFTPLLSEFGWTRAETILAYALSFLVQSGLGIIAGWLTDKLGPRIVVAVFGSFIGWSYLLMSQIQTLWQFVICYSVLGGIGASTLNIPIMATVTRWFIKRRGLMVGIVQAGAGIGGLFLAPLSGRLILHYGWRNASLLLGVVTAALMILSGLFLIRDPKDIGQFPDGSPPEENKDKKIQIETKRTAGVPLGLLMRTAPFWMVSGIYASFGYIRSTFIAHTPTHVQDLGFSLVDGANVMAVISFVSIIGRVGMGRVADMIGNRRTLIISFTAFSLSIGWLLIVRNLWGLYLFALVYGFAWGALAVLRFAVTAEVFGLASAGFIMGIVAFPDSISAMLSSYLGGFIGDIAGSYRAAFAICAAISCLGIILSWLLKPAQLHAGDSNADAGKR
ncbi:MAG: MFS transporter [Pseudomonadota bacterium]